MRKILALGLMAVLAALVMTAPWTSPSRAAPRTIYYNIRDTTNMSCGRTFYSNWIPCRGARQVCFMVFTTDSINSTVTPDSFSNCSLQITNNLVDTVSLGYANSGIPRLTVTADNPNVTASRIRRALNGAGHTILLVPTTTTSSPSNTVINIKAVRIKLTALNRGKSGNTTTIQDTCANTHGVDIKAIVYRED